ncbi:MAG: hypothetical protein ACFFCZ_08700 [Promethearchaeota archaeon]
MRRFDELVVLISKYFLEHNVPFVVIGGVAILFQGRFRTTEDIDFIILQDKLDIDSFINYCQHHSLNVRKFDLTEGFKEKFYITILDLSNLIRIDLKGAYSGWDLGAIKEAEAFDYENTSIKVARPEYLITNKLKKGGQIDLEDAYSVFFKNEERLDRKLLKELAILINVEKELVEFLETALKLKKS